MWDFVKYNSLNTTKSSGTYLEPYYTMVKGENNKNELGLIQIYTQNNMQNIISYLVGTTEDGKNKLRVRKFSADSNIVSPMQLDKQIEEDEAISTELKTLETTGTRITKKMIVVPLENTLLYVEPVYQTMINESEIPLLKKVIVASGSKVAIGDTLQEALKNLLSNYAGNIEIENTEDENEIVNSIIKANQNLKDSTNNNDWELMGTDIKKLQSLIDSLEKIRKEENTTNNSNTANTSVEENNVINNTQKNNIVE